MTINMGPQHPSTHGVLRLILTLDGETIVKAVPDIGYLHTGIEKTAESKSYFKALVLTDRMDYLAPLCNNLGYSLAVEKLLGIEVPARRAVRARRAGRVAAHRQPSRLAGLQRARPGRAERLPLLLPRARDDPRHLRAVLRRAHDDELHHARAACRPICRRASSGRCAPSSSSSRRGCANTTTC